MKHNLPVVLLLFIHFFLIIQFIKIKSPTFDELVHLSSGYSYLKTADYRMNKEHPPLAKMIAALPLLFFDLASPKSLPGWYQRNQWQFSEYFIYHNKMDPEKMIFIGRISISILSLFLGYFVFLWSKRLFGYEAGLISLGFYVFSPNILANAPIIHTDLPSALFIFIAVFTFLNFLDKPNWKNAVISGITLGAALATKFTAFALPILYMFFISSYRFPEGSSSKIPIIILLTVFTVLLTYQFKGLGTYISGFTRVMMEASESGHTSFFCGNFSNVGWRYYYFGSFFFKSTLPLIIILILSIIYSKNKLEIWLPVLLLLLFAAASKKQIGHRYILPIYPFLFVWISSLALHKSKIMKLILILLLSLHIYSSLSAAPHYIAYFNEIIGRNNGWKFLANSNIDWGQDLKELSEYIKKEKISDVILSYYGNANPKYYKIDFQDLGTNSIIKRKGKINSLQPKKEIIAISVNNLIGLYFYDREVFSWLKEKKPDHKIGYSIFIYDITYDITSHEKLAQIYFESNLLKEAERECRRLLLMDEKNGVAHFTLACIYALGGQEKLSLRHYLKSKPGFKPEKHHILNFWNYRRGDVKPGNYDRAIPKLMEIVKRSGYKWKN